MNARQPAAAAPTGAGTVPGRDTPRPARETGGAVPLTVDAKTMAAALADGSARTLNLIVTGIVTYRDQWWLDDDDTWVLITDDAFAASLDERRTRNGWS